MQAKKVRWVVPELQPTIGLVTQALVQQAEFCKSEGMVEEARIFAKYARRLGEKHSAAGAKGNVADVSFLHLPANHQ